jgi:hypothetical protein
MAEFNSSASALVCASYLGGSSNDVAYGLTLFGTLIVVAGGTSSSNFPTTSTHLQGSLSGSSDGFVTAFVLPNMAT